MSAESASEQLAREVARIARAAGSAIMTVYGHGRNEVAYKSDASPVTAADLAANTVISRELARLEPRCAIVSEEGPEDDAARIGATRIWMVDPLDGTKEFLKRSGEFTVNIALIEDGRPVLGVVHAPALALTYVGVVGAGAWRSRGDQAQERIQVAQAGTEARVVASLNHAGPDLPGYLERLGAHRCVSLGSSLKLCLVAEGAADVYPRLGPTMEWDTAAADAVVRAAGGVVVDRDGRELRYNKTDLHNPWFFACAGDVGRWVGGLVNE